MGPIGQTGSKTCLTWSDGELFFAPIRVSELAFCRLTEEPGVVSGVRGSPMKQTYDQFRALIAGDPMCRGGPTVRDEVIDRVCPG